MNYHFISSEIIKNTWSGIKYHVLEQIVNNKKNLYLYNVYTLKYEIVPLEILEKYIKNIDDDFYKIFYIQCNCLDIEDKYQLNLLRIFHSSWLNHLWEYLNSTEFKIILKRVNTDRETNKVFPEQKSLFTTFLTDYTTLKGCFLGLSPYQDEKHANGIAFSTYSNIIPPSLQILQNAFRLAINKSKMYRIPNDLLYLQSQGILLLNCALSTNTISPISHIDIWKPFIIKIINTLNEKDNFTWLLFGNQAKTYNSYINKQFNVIEEYHPAYYARQKTEMSGDKIKQFINFTQIEL